MNNVIQPLTLIIFTDRLLLTLLPRLCLASVFVPFFPAALIALYCQDFNRLTFFASSRERISFVFWKKIQSVSIHCTGKTCFSTAHTTINTLLRKLHFFFVWLGTCVYGGPGGRRVKRWQSCDGVKGSGLSLIWLQSGNAWRNAECRLWLEVRSSPRCKPTTFLVL